MIGSAVVRRLSPLAPTLTLLTLLVAAPARAQVTPLAPRTIAVGDFQLEPLAEMRARVQYRREPEDLGGWQEAHGALHVQEYVRNAWIADSRARLGLGAERGPVRLQITLQDARVFGSRRDASTTAYEAWIEARTSAARPSVLRLGRQAVRWGEGRLLGAADWSPRGRSLDAIRGRLRVGKVGAELLGAVLDAPSPAGPAYGAAAGPPSSGTELAGARLEAEIDPWIHLELYALARVARSGDLSYRSTFANARAAGELYTGALRLSGEGRGLSYGVEGAYQMGSASRLAGPVGLTAGAADVAAWAAYAHVSRRFDEIALSPTLRLGGAYATGEDGGSTYRAFDPILPDPFVAHGMMDLFAWSNVVEANARLAVAPFTDAELAVDYRYLRLAESAGEWLGGYLTPMGRLAGALPPAPASSETELGHEIDASFRWEPWPVVDVLLAYSIFARGPAARAALATSLRGSFDASGAVTTEPLSHQGLLSVRARLF